MEYNTAEDLTTLIREVLGENISPQAVQKDAPLFGGLLDSMAVTTLIVSIEEHFPALVRFTDDLQMDLLGIETVLEEFAVLGPPVLHLRQGHRTSFFQVFR